MNAWLVAAALGLLAAWPLTVAGSLIGLLAERLTRAPRVREVAWGVVFVLPLLFLLQVLGGRFFADAFATAPAVAAHTARVHSTLPLSSIAPPAAPPLFEALLARPEAVWIAIAVLALSLMGAVARVAMWVAGRQRLAFVIRRAAPLNAPELADALAREAAQTRVGVPPVLVSEEIDRPMLAGLRRPAILIPAETARQLDARRLALIGLHELAHLRRGDNLRRPLEEALLGLFWMTPPLALVRSRMAAATEEACDSQALRNAEPTVRKLYAQALIDTLRLGAGPEHAPAFIGAGRRSRLMRMNAILNPARPARPLTIALLGVSGAALIAAAGFAARTAAAQAAAAQPDPAPATKTVTIISSDPGKSADGKTATVTMKIEGDVDLDGKRVHLKGKPMTLVVDSGDATTKVMHVKGTVDTGKDSPGAVVVDGNIDLSSADLKLDHGKKITLVSPGGATTKQVFTVVDKSGDKKKVYFLSTGDVKTQPFIVTDKDGKSFRIESDRGASAKDDPQTRGSADGEGPIDLQADRLTTYKAQGLMVYSGNPTIRAQGKFRDGVLELNGKPAPPGFDPSSLPPDQLDRIEVQMDGAKLGHVNLVTKSPAG